MAGIYHQPFEVRIVNQDFKKLFPRATVTPANKAAMCIAPPPVIWRKISPRRTGAHDPKHRIDKASVVLCDATPTAFAPRQMRRYFLPNGISNIVSPVHRYWHKLLAFGYSTSEVCHKNLI
jgi:hypothetical protein